MAGFARWCFVHRRAVLAAWLIALIGFFGVSKLAGTTYDNSGGGGEITSLLLGIVLALVVLFFAFRRSVLAALLPLISALVAIGAGLSIVTILTHAISVASWVPEFSIIVSLGVGVDYALFIVSRHRNGLLAGQTPEDAAVTAPTPPAAPCCWPG